MTIQALRSVRNRRWFCQRLRRPWSATLRLFANAARQRITLPRVRGVRGVGRSALPACAPARRSPRVASPCCPGWDQL